MSFSQSLPNETGVPFPKPRTPLRDLSTSSSTSHKPPRPPLAMSTVPNLPTSSPTVPDPAAPSKLKRLSLVASLRSASLDGEAGMAGPSTPRRPTRCLRSSISYSPATASRSSTVLRIMTLGGHDEIIKEESERSMDSLEEARGRNAVRTEVLKGGDPSEKVCEKEGMERRVVGRRGQILTEKYVLLVDSGDIR